MFQWEHTRQAGNIRLLAHNSEILPPPGQSQDKIPHPVKSEDGSRMISTIPLFRLAPDSGAARMGAHAKYRVFRPRDPAEFQ